jgi:hypothetical protein
MSRTAQPTTATPRPKLVPRLHEPVSGAPYLDEELVSGPKLGLAERLRELGLDPEG